MRVSDADSHGAVAFPQSICGITTAQVHMHDCQHHQHYLLGLIYHHRLGNSARPEDSRRQ